MPTISERIGNILYGNVRGTTRSNYSEGDNRVSLSNAGEMVVVQGLPPRSELVRQGGSWTVVTPAANHFTPVAAMPTTRAEMVLYNGEQSGGKSYLIDSVFAVADASIAAAAAIALLGQLVPSGTAPADNASVLISSRSGKVNYGGSARKAIANTSFGVADKWQVLSPSAPSSGTATIGLAAYAELYGGFIVPPGGLFLANMIAGTAAGSALIGITWHEVQLPLG